MNILFIVSIIGIIVIFPIYYLSLEHNRLENKFGKEKGRKIGNILGMISGWGFYIFWMGIWFSPQPRFTIPLLNIFFIIPFFDFILPLIHIIISIPFIVLAIYLGIKGVIDTSLKTAETHRPEKVVTTGLYNYLRHPQYLGGLLAHIGISFIMSALYSILSTPFIIIYIYLLAWKEEKELVKEFPEEYLDYKKKVPMFIPKFWKK
ncbi:MAG: DUF1295 domain-containing protein [Candidatus Lokiarchaeota archaeon]|nr:DUF1295 domain-containing protein [Candidatus Lokiarchaeota archaeon]